MLKLATGCAVMIPVEVLVRLLVVWMRVPVPHPLRIQHWSRWQSFWYYPLIEAWQTRLLVVTLMWQSQIPA